MTLPFRTHIYIILLTILFYIVMFDFNFCFCMSRDALQVSQAGDIHCLRPARRYKVRSQHAAVEQAVQTLRTSKRASSVTHFPRGTLAARAFARLNLTDFPVRHERSKRVGQTK